MATKSKPQIVTYDVFEGLSSWELVNPSDDEQDHTDDDQELLKQEDPFDLKQFDDEKMCKQENPCSFGIPMKSLSLFVDDSFKAADDDNNLDDELVPIWLSDKFGRQRIRKVGKRFSSRMNKSKRLPYYYNRPGFVSGKHGLVILFPLPSFRFSFEKRKIFDWVGDAGDLEGRYDRN
ncbi:hypothetical protein K7X08_037993 [Anisodus acutangulus]|uniref:Uncharacterized protein n=1 Tax=Anisodus acutangulus TaxID=402998 RepID=A0A9Q1N3G3_9SOLA|nr:hypothetical protein K7X08_037993 [Anisodus acutangulus]